MQTCTEKKKKLKSLDWSKQLPSQCESLAQRLAQRQPLRSMVLWDFIQREMESPSHVGGGGVWGVSAEKHQGGVGCTHSKGSAAMETN